MFGQEVFARDDEGYYYLLNTPTDVRLVREGDYTEEALAQWSAFYAWINGSVCDRFIAENGLTLCQVSSTDVDLILARIAWMGETNYTITSLADGTHGPGNGKCAAYAEKIRSDILAVALGPVENADAEDKAEIGDYTVTIKIKAENK